MSAVIVFTEKGMETLSQSNCVLTEEPLEVVAEGQMKKKLRMPSMRTKVLSMLQDETVELDKINKMVKMHQLLDRVKYYSLHPGYVVNRLKTKLIGK